jgi:hypothetical protein
MIRRRNKILESWYITNIQGKSRKNNNDDLKLEIYLLLIVFLIILSIFLLFYLFIVLNVEDKTTAKEIKEPKIEIMPVVDRTEFLAEITKYTNRKIETDETPNLMASGKRVYEGAVACPIWLKFGQKILIDGQVYTCEDRMAYRYRYDNYFDIFTFNLNEALVFGRQKKIVKVLE